MILAKRVHTVGNRTRYWVDYSTWLPEGVTVSAFAVSSSSLTLTVDTVAALPSGICQFFLNGGALGETATITLTITDSKTGVKHDTIAVSVLAP